MILTINKMHLPYKYNDKETAKFTNQEFILFIIYISRFKNFINPLSGCGAHLNYMGVGSNIISQIVQITFVLIFFVA